MKLSDLANDLNREADAKHKAVEEAEKQRAAYSRKVSYYKEFGNMWFSELARKINTLSDSFNRTAGQQAVIKSNLDTNPEIHSIAIELVPQNVGLVCTNAHCSVVQKQDDLKVVIRVIKGPNTSNLECDVKITDFTEFKVQVILKHQKSVIDEKATDRYCDIDDENFFPIFKTVTTQEEKTFKTGEFAEFVLTHVVQVAKEKRRA